MPKAQVNGVTFHYQQMGEGPDLVLLHGLAGNLAFWYPTISARLGAGYRVTVFDLRGHGYSGTPQSGYTTRDMAEDLRGLLEHLKIESARLVGHSYGGAVALHFAVLCPARVTSLVLADVHVRSLNAFPDVPSSPHWSLLQRKLAENGFTIPAESPDFVLRLLEAVARRRLEGTLKEDAFKPLYVPLLAGSRRVAEQWLRLIEETTAIEDFKSIAGLTVEEIRKVCQPTLALYGAMSHCLGSQKELVELLPNCTAKLIEGVGHFHPVVAPAVFGEIVCEFLGQVEPLSQLSPRGYVA